MSKDQSVQALVVKIVRHRSRERQIPLQRRQVNVYPGLKGDYWINKFEIKIKLGYAVTGNPFDMIDPVLDAVIEFDLRETEERARGITKVKSEIMQRTAYLERTLPRAMYSEFIQSLYPNSEDND